MLKSYEAIYEHGQIRWLDTPPEVDTARIIVTVLPPADDRSKDVPKRHPPEKLKGRVRVVGDIVSSPYVDEAWESMIERTARQLSGDSEAFK
jgi:hypothetical protein